jgi:hypothetical protein
MRHAFFRSLPTHQYSVLQRTRGIGANRQATLEA